MRSGSPTAALAGAETDSTPPMATAAVNANPVSPLARYDFVIAEFPSWVSSGCESCRPLSAPDLRRTFGEPATVGDSPHRFALLTWTPHHSDEWMGHPFGVAPR